MKYLSCYFFIANLEEMKSQYFIYKPISNQPPRKTSKGQSLQFNLSQNLLLVRKLLYFWIKKWTTVGRLLDDAVKGPTFIEKY